VRLRSPVDAAYQRAPASKAKAQAKKPSRRATTAKAAAKSAKKPVKKPAKKQTAPARLGQPHAAATLPYIGQIASFPFAFAPDGWAACKGQILPISQYVTLFSLIRTTYGGNGTTVFALPNLPPRGPSGPWYYVALEGVFPPQG
jgi:hypothetical protein